MDIPYTVEIRRDTGLTNGKIGIWLFLASEVMLFGALFASRASAADVHRTAMGSSMSASLLAVAGIIAPNGHLLSAFAEASAGPIRTPSDWTTCVSYAFVSIAIS